MCGICGQYNFKSDIPISSINIKTMTNTLKHRGPDDEGYYIAKNIGLGFRRLAIIDLEGGHQPMSDAEETVWVVFNGEIYNFLELRSELENYGYNFRTNSDTEVIINGYKHWNIEVLNHLNGMFGLAIWDEKKRKLILARDRMGIKLLYYEIENGSIIFGSEIRALLACEKATPEVDPISLYLFLQYRYTPSPLTIFKNIKKLAPGTCLIIENNVVKTKRWWNFKPVPFIPMPKKTDAEEELLELYKKAVKRHLISDVPVGLLLSGGIDSALLLALMNLYGESWKTFTVGFGKEYFDDELEDAAYTSEALNAVNTAIQIDRITFEKTLSEIISYLEEPIASSSIVAMYHVCKHARKDVKVALIGQGPDELFGGYKRHLGVHYASYWRLIPKFIRLPLKEVFALLPRNESIKRGIYSLDEELNYKRYQKVFSIMPKDAIDELFCDKIIATNTDEKIHECWNDIYPLMENTDELGGLQFIEIRSSLPDELLMYSDKLSMAHSLELRVPYLDFEIVEYVERLNASFKIHNFKRKWLHKQVSKKFLPKEIINRRKRGFTVNIVDDWFRYAMSEKMDSILLNKKSLIFNYLKFNPVQQLLINHQNRKQDNHKILFSLVLFEKWLQSYYS
jgi:asparagine synthase (glutamine-hydrolysing)